VATHEDKMLAAMSLQTELLGMLVKGEKGDQIDAGMKGKLDEVRSNRLASEKNG
jgi:hypothetical protein